MPDKRIPLRSFGDEGPAEQRTCFRVTQALQSACAFTTDSVDDVVGGLDKLSLDDNAFYVVDAPNGDFMQVGGCKERLTVELRQLVEGGFFHFVAGYEAEPGREAHVPCESGVVTCRESQVMGIEDARLLVRAFCEGTEILPPGYLFEEVSHRFTGSAYAYSDVLGPVAATLGVEQDRFPVIVKIGRAHV